MITLRSFHYIVKIRIKLLNLKHNGELKENDLHIKCLCIKFLVVKRKYLHPITPVFFNLFQVSEPFKNFF